MIGALIGVALIAAVCVFVYIAVRIVMAIILGEPFDEEWMP